MFGLTYGTRYGAGAVAPPVAFRVPGDTYATARFDVAGELRPELIQAPGPAGIGVTGAGDAADLHGTAWFAAWSGGGVQLAYRSGMTWVPAPDASAIPTLPRTARHLGLAFDQSARPVFAWDDGAALVIRQWDASTQTYQSRGPFPGVDPVLLADLAVQYDVPSSDVLAFYLTPDRSGLRFRVQRENYLVEHIVLNGLSGWVLDQVNHFPYEAQLVGEDATGVEVAVMIGPYQHAYVGRDDVASSASAPSGGVLALVVVIQAGSDRAALAAAAPSGGTIRDVVLLQTGLTHAAMSASAPSGGTIRDVVLFEASFTPAALSAAAPSGGTLTLVVLTASGASAAVASAFAPSGGTIQ